jgi:adenosylmethionine-8-amino-7-oxononanoate aminotransferase
MPVAAKDFTITYSDGHTALCGTSGVWNVSLGYGNEAIARAIYEATSNASYLGQFRTSHVYAERAAEALLAEARGDYRRVLFATSGSAAVDASIKIARLHAWMRRDTARRVIVTIRGSYHGMTLSAMSVAGQDLGQRLLGVAQDTTRMVDRDDAAGFARLADSLGERIAAVIVEPVLGSGTLPVSRELIAEILAQRARHGYLVIADEVATGFGRTGPMFASDLWPASPDLLIASKALTNGTVAASAILWSRDLADLHDCLDVPLYHAETQAGTPASCAAILATIEEYRRKDALARATRTEAALVRWLDHMTGLLPGVTQEGAGCFRSLHLRHHDATTLDAQEIQGIVEATRIAGAVIYPGPSCIQLIPALTYEPIQLERLLDITGHVLTHHLATTAKAA